MMPWVFSKAKSSALVQKKQTYDALLQLAHQKGVKVVATHRHRQMLFLSVHQNTKKGTHKEEPEEPMGAEKLVTHMIDGMVGVLHDEDVGDEHKKAWCANETAIAHQIEAQKEETIEKTKTEIAEQEDELATTVAEIKALTSKIAELDKMVHEATENRKEQHQEFVDSFATSATAMRLIDKAIKRMEKFYSPEKFAAAKKATTEAALAKAGLSLNQKKSGEPQADPALVAKMQKKLMSVDFDALVQVHQQISTGAQFVEKVRNGVDPIVLPDTPKTYEKKESGGVMGLMNEFKTDLKTDMTESETSEKMQAKDYVRMMGDAHATRKQDVKSLQDKETAKAALDQSLSDHKKKLMLVEEETGLEAAESIVTENEPPTHKDIENRYKQEHTDDDVDEHYPGTPIDDGPDKF